MYLKPNVENSLDFAGRISKRVLKNYLLVSVDNSSGWPDAELLLHPTTEKAIEFLLEFMSTNRIKKRTRTDL